MIRSTTWNAREERLLWALMVGGALLIVFLFAESLASAAEPQAARTPALLPPDMAQVARPLVRVQQPDVPWDFLPPGEPATDVVMNVWTVLREHKDGEFEAALEDWRALQLAPNADVWRQIAIGQAHMALGQLEEAATELTLAEEWAPDNAVVHYYLGLLRLEQAAVAPDWYDAAEPGPIRLVAYAPRQVVPNSRSMLELTARMELETAIALADDVRLEQPLTPEGWYSTLAAGPTVGDLLRALGADNFAAKAQNVLGRLLLDQRDLLAAEAHMDAAVAGGMYVGFGYQDLAQAYETAGRHDDATRVRAKAAKSSFEPLHE